MRTRPLTFPTALSESSTEQLEASNAARLRQEWTTHLERFDWHHYCTLTAQPTAPDKLRREFMEGFIRRLARCTQEPISWFYTLERGAGGTAHMHALLSGTLRLTTLRVQRAWDFGFAHVRVYDPSRGAAHYLTKDVVFEHGDYDVSRRMPPVLGSEAA